MLLISRSGFSQRGLLASRGRYPVSTVVGEWICAVVGNPEHNVAEGWAVNVHLLRDNSPEYTSGVRFP